MCVGLLLLGAQGAFSYSVLTHEAIIDSLWDRSIRVLLLERFPDASTDELTQAHAYAYGVPNPGAAAKIRRYVGAAQPALAPSLLNEPSKGNGYVMCAAHVVDRGLAIWRLVA